MLLLGLCLAKGSPGSLGACIACDTSDSGKPWRAVCIKEHVTIVPIRGLGHVTVRRAGIPELLKLEVPLVAKDHLINSRYFGSSD